MHGPILIAVGDIKVRLTLACFFISYRSEIKVNSIAKATVAFVEKDSKKEHCSPCYLLISYFMIMPDY